jgi:hypothetical protein
MAWNTDSTANRLIKSFVQDFIDISGSLILRDKSNLYVNGNTTVNGNLSLNNASILTDLSFNKKIFVGGDCSLNGNLTSVGDISINGNITRCIFNDSSIPQNAFNGTISAPGPDYTKASVFYDQKFKANADISLNGNVVQVNNIKINGNIKFSDDSSLNKYDDNMSKLSDLSSAYISSVCFTTPVGFAYIDTRPLDDRFYKLKSSSSGKIIAIIAGGTNYHTGNTNAPSSNDPIGSWNNYSKFGVYITRDFGNTWTKYLMPYEDGTKLGYSYFDIAMSRDGKHIVIIVTPNGNSSGLPNAIAFSHDYGYTWSSTRFPVYSGSPSYLSWATMCCISDDGRRMLVANMGEAPVWYASNNYGLSWIEKLNASYSGNFMRLAYPLYCNADLTKIFVALANNTLHVISLDENFTQVSYSAISASSARTSVSGDSFPQRVSPGNIQNLCISPDSKNILVAYGGGGGTGITNTYLEFYDATTDRWRSVTPTLNASNGTSLTTGTTYIYLNGIQLMSGSGKIIYLRGSSGNPSSSNVFLLSTDYGSTFTQVPALDASVYAVYDDGSFLSFNGQISYDPTINIFKPNIYKDSTFASLTITGNLRAGTFPTPSDYRIKNDVAALDKTFTIDNLRPVKYLQTLINKTRYGVIAHELQLYYPDLVVGEKDGEDLQYVNYTGLIAILINEIKRLKQEVLELENEV